MNLKTTLVLALLVLGGSAAWLYHAWRQPAPARSETLDFLRDEVTEKKLTRIVVERGPGQELVLERTADTDDWTEPGNWDTRKPEVKELVETLTGLRSRYAPLVIHNDDEWTAYGLDRPAVTVRIRLQGDTEEHTLRLAVEPEKPETHYARPTYLRLDDKNEAVRLRPGLVADLTRPRDYFMQRRLFPAERVKDREAQGRSERLTAQLAKAVSIRETKAAETLSLDAVLIPLGIPALPVLETRYTLTSDGAEWKLSAPFADMPDRERLKSLLGAVPDLWAEKFVENPDKDLATYGLQLPEQALSVTLAGRKPKILLIGKPSRPHETVPYRYAKLADNQQIFEIKADRLHDIFIAFRDLRDAQLTGFDPKDAQRIEVDLPGQQILLVHEKIKKKVKLGAKAEEQEEDRWRLEQPLQAEADSARVGDLLQALSNLRLQESEVHYKPDPKTYGLEQAAATVRVETKKEEPKSTPESRNFTLRFGKPNDDKVYVQVGGRDLVSPVDKQVLATVSRKEIELLKRELLSLDRSAIKRVQSTGTGGTLTLERGEGNTWKAAQSGGASFMAQGFALDGLLAAWSPLRAERFVAVGADANLAKYGLDKPGTTIRVTVQPSASDSGSPASAVEHTLFLGKPVEAPPPLTMLACWSANSLPVNLVLATLSSNYKHLLKPPTDTASERYARLDDQKSVFVLGRFEVGELQRTYLDFVDRTIVKFDPVKVTALQRRMGDEELEVDKRDGGWHLVKPAERKADDSSMDELLNHLSALTAQRIAAYPAKDLKPFGLDKPAAVIKLQGAGPKVVELQLGKVADEASGDRFGMLAGSSTVAVLPGSVVRSLLGAPLQFRDRTLPSLVEADNAILERGKRKVTFAKVDGTWKVTEPLTASAEHDSLEDFVNALTHLRADAWVAEKPSDLKAYGLEPAQARWHFRLNDKDVLELLVGSPEKASELGHEGLGKRCYAKLAKTARPRLEMLGMLACVPMASLPGSVPWAALASIHLPAPAEPADLVFLLDPKTTTLAQGEYRDRTLWTALEPSQVESLSYTGGHDKFVLKKMNETWQFAGKLGLPVNTQAVTDTLESLSKLRAERYIVDKDATLKEFGLEPPHRVIEVQTRTGGKYVLQLGDVEKGSKRYYAHVPQGSRTDVFVISEADAARIVRELPAFIQTAPKFPPTNP
jgi:hypothetical protein